MGRVAESQEPLLVKDWGEELEGEEGGMWEEDWLGLMCLGSDSEGVEAGGLVVMETASDIDGAGRCWVGQETCWTVASGGSGVGGGDCGGFENCLVFRGDDLGLWGEI
ncbi:unnamed protein product [Prunus armeniaca]|uniref:Uncharacterized protein n=1 Tax=Prunus armeniaca TaxID=36596 RepID=A0A6J5XAQ5_PRUAR|nr:unnamed protein product [Prunus armeniaca]